MHPSKREGDRPIFDIRDFGAVCDGKTDCRKALEEAMAAATRTGGKVYFPPNTHLEGGDARK
jgi:polygalacturonase